MATLLMTDGTKKKIETHENILSIQDISRILNGMVEPLFVGEFWVFMCRNAAMLRREYNKEASKLIGMDVFGDIILAQDTELSPTFFFPPEVIEEIKSMTTRIAKHLVKNSEEEDPDEELLSEELKEEAMELLMQESYKNLFEKGKSFKDIIANFELYNDGNQVIVIAPIMKERIDAVDNILDYFTKKEEYDKCAKLVEFKKRLEKYYNNF